MLMSNIENKDPRLASTSMVVDDDDVSPGATRDLPSEVHLVVHHRAHIDLANSRIQNYADKRIANTSTQLVAAHYQYEYAVATASRYVREIFAMDEEDEEWLEQLDWQGGSYQRQ
jgi:hypothetical protein